ncbi:MAG: hypothetical protein Q9165_005798 [Trypethelium subeluteriae]
MLTAIRGRSVPRIKLLAGGIVAFGVSQKHGKPYLLGLDERLSLGLAGNIVQFLDFAFKLVSGTRTIYRSTEGASEENSALQTIATDLLNLSDQLTISTTRGTTNVGPTLRRIAFDCQDVALELVRVLSTLQAEGKRRIWKSFLLALQEVWKQGEISRLNGRLDNLQKDLNTHLLKLLL